jgi:hypothetical protein
MLWLAVRTIAGSLGSRISTGVWGKGPLAMVDDREEWEMCEEREGEERRGAGQNSCTRSCIEATGGILSIFLGQKMSFCPRNMLRIPQKSFC